MRFFSTALALAAVPAAVLGATQTVTVGEGGMQMFNPQTMMAAVGDTVNFQFMAKNHSVTQSLFASPCTKAMFNGTAGVNSGFMATPANVTNGSFPTWSITVKDTSPLWFYCAQKVPAVHCQNGMVFSINPSADKTHEAFVAAAKASVSNSTNSSTPAGGDASGASPSGASPSGASTSDASGATPSGATPSDAASAGAASGASGASSSDSAASSLATGSGVAAAASSSNTATSAADNSPTSGASKTAFARGAAGLFTVAAAVGAVLL